MALCLWLLPTTIVGGGLVEVAAGDIIVMPYPTGGEVYAIRGPLFDNIYALEDPQSRVPTHDELVAKWSMVLRNKEGSLHRKSEVVYAKAAGETYDQVVQKPADEESIEIEVTLQDRGDGGVATTPLKPGAMPAASNGCWNVEYVTCGELITNDAGDETDAAALERRIEKLIKELAAKDKIRAQSFAKVMMVHLT